MKKYIRIYLAYWKNAISYEVQYRGDMLVKLLLHAVEIGILLLFVEVIFSVTPTFSDWSKGSVYLLTISWMFLNEVLSLLFWPNLASIPDYVTDGELDRFLTKPASTLFLVSNQYVVIKSVYRLFIQMIVLAVILVRFDMQIRILESMLGFIAFIAAVAIFYAVLLILNTFSFWFFRIENVNDLLGSVIELGKYPIHILPKTIQIIFLTVVPVAFSGFVPAALLTGHWPWYGALYAVLFASGIVGVAVLFWRFAIRHYSSASG